MTQAIASWMRDMDDTWQRHRDAVLARDLGAALAGLAPDPAVRHIPAMTGADGRDEVEAFYARDLVPGLPADLAVKTISRTVDRFRLVDEVSVSFTHDCELPWLLPGVSPTGRAAQVLVIAVVELRRRLIRRQRILWDHATLAAQLGLPGLVTTAPPTARRGQAGAA